MPQSVESQRVGNDLAIEQQIVMVSATHQHELATGIDVTRWGHPIPPGCHRSSALGSLHHTSNSHRLSVLHMVMFMFQ